MSVIVKFPGARIERFRLVYDHNVEAIQPISGEGRSKGALGHQIVEDENDCVLVIDEWGSAHVSEAFVKNRVWWRL